MWSGREVAVKSRIRIDKDVDAKRSVEYRRAAFRRREVGEEGSSQRRSPGGRVGEKRRVAEGA